MSKEVLTEKGTEFAEINGDGKSGSEQEPSKSNAQNKIAGGIAFSILGLAAYGVIRLGEDTANKTWGVINSIRNPILEGPEKPVFPMDREGRRIPEFDQDLIRNLQVALQAHQALEIQGGRLQTLLHTSQSNETVTILDQLGRSFIFQGANVLQTAWLLGHTEDKAFIDPKGENLWINDNYYSLKNRFEMQLASAWIQTKLSIIHSNLKINSLNKDEDIDELSASLNNLQEELEVLTWFRQRSPSIFFGEESFAFFAREEMVKMARIFKAVDNLGFGLPTLDWCQKIDCIKRHGRAGGYFRAPNQLILENTIPARAAAHEAGHWVNRQNDLLNRYEIVRGVSGKVDLPEERLKHVTEYAMTNEDEDFASTFEEFLLNGDYFRSLLTELQVSAPHAWQALQRKYDFMKNEVFRGREFSQNGKPRIPVFEAREQEFSGIYWSAQNRTLEIRPNPNVWSGKRKIFKQFPVLQGTVIQTIGIDLELFLRSAKYNINLMNPDLVNEIFVSPLPGNDRVQVNAVGLSFPADKRSEDFNDLKRQIEDGNAFLKRISPGSTGLNSLTLEARSFLPIALGQSRVIRDNDFQWSQAPISLRGYSNDRNRENPYKLYSGASTYILEGPRRFMEIESGEIRDFWLVGVVSPEEFTNLNDYYERYDRYIGWVSERWIGEEFKQTTN